MKIFLLIASLISSVLGEKYAVLVAGSKDIWNYRHQSDVCHSYHVLTNHGFDPKNIILFSYDDIPNSPENPIPGTLYNKPGNNSVNVNKGCVKDYIGKEVTSENFLNVIQGKKEAMQGKGSEKVLESTAEDQVFISFVDHGSSGVIAFPNDFLFAHELIDALKEMHTQKMYQKLVFFIEACESGSMFEGKLPDNIEVYGMTAADATQSSFAAYCPPNDVVNGVKIGSCLGDLFSVSWMENADQVNINTETLEQQYEVVKNRTFRSNVSKYGSMSFISNPVGEFLGTQSSKALGASPVVSNNWESRDNKLHYLYNKYMEHPNWENAQEIMAELMKRERQHSVFEKFSRAILVDSPGHLMSERMLPMNTVCLKEAISAYHEFCGQFDDYGMKFIQVLANACELEVPQSKIADAFYKICSFE